jgi:hypothetical protein
MSSPQPANPDATHALTRRWWTEDAEGLNRGEALLAALRANAGSRPPLPREGPARHSLAGRRPVEP